MELTIMKKCLLAACLSMSLTMMYATTQAPVIHQFNNQPEIASTVITVKNPDVVAEAVNSSATEVYLELDNSGKTDHRVLAATSPAAQMAQLHDMYEKNGQMIMHQVRMIPIPAHKDELLNGNFHIMLIDTSKHLTSGQIIPITLIFEDGSWLNFNARVK